MSYLNEILLENQCRHSKHFYPQAKPGERKVCPECGAVRKLENSVYQPLRFPKHSRLKKAGRPK